ncbi:MAG: carboxypeptidase-like regulatory domain-containing protein, partial [Bacteroidota bacterium]
MYDAALFYQQIAQFAPYIVREGKMQPVLLIYVNNQLVYYYDVYDRPPYSFIGVEGENEIRIRTPKYEYTFDQLKLKKGHKVVFSIDEEQFSRSKWGGNIRRKPKPNTFTSQEKYFLRQSIFVLKTQSTGIHILQQGPKNIHLFSVDLPLVRTLPQYIRVGPFQQRNIRYHYYEEIERSLFFEPGFSYAISRDRERLYAYDWLEADQPLPEELPIPNPKQKVFRPADLQPFQVSPLKMPYSRKYSDLMYGNCRYVMRLPQAAATAVFYALQDSNGRVTYYAPGKSVFRRLKPSTYDLYIFNREGAYWKHQFELRSGNTLFQDLREAHFYQDSSYQMMRAILPEIDRLRNWPNSIRRALEAAEQRKELLSYSLAWGEQRTINGYVIDEETEEPLIGANLAIKGMNLGTVTDVDGYFELAVPYTSYELMVSYLGYTPKIIQLGPQSRTVEIRLEASQTLLSEVVILGYGRDMTQVNSIAPTKDIVQLSSLAAAPPSLANSIMAGLSKEASALTGVRADFVNDFQNTGEATGDQYG